MQKGIRNIDWKRRAPWIISYLKLAKKGNRPKAMPALMHKYGVDNFKEEKGALYVFDRKVVIDEKEKNKYWSALNRVWGDTRAPILEYRKHILVFL